MKRVWTDRDLLEVLSALDSGQTSYEVAAAFGARGTTIRTMTQRIRQAEQPCLCTKPENMDGGMPERWWAA